MSIPESQMEVLVARCVDAGEAGYREELERVCAEHPLAAAELRQRVASLEQLGFLGQQTPPDREQWFPDRIGGYRLTGLLGRGGMGVVFAGSKDGGEPVAIKIVRPDLLTDSRARERFRREALLAARLSHPGICPVLEVGIDDDVPYLVMPLLRGRTFGAWLHEQRPDRNRMLAMLEAHARALHAAHEAGLVHRDVTPANLFVSDDERAIVLDFGLARDTTGAVATVTKSQELLGTLPYMAPEQLTAAARIDRRADIYSLGVVLYHALAGQPPFASEHRSELSRLILAGQSPRLRRLVRDLPRSLDLVVHKAIDVDPGHRYVTAEDLADDVRRCWEGRAVLARGLSVGVRTRRWVQHHPVVATALALLSIMLVMAGVMVRREQFAREEAQSNAAQLASKVREFDQLKAVVHCDDAIVAERELYPAWPHKIAAMETWLGDDAGRLLAMRAGIEQTVKSLRARALPATAAEIAEDRKAHPRFAEWQALERKLSGLQRARAVREGRAKAEVPALSKEAQAQDAEGLNTLAWARVAPEDGAGGRTVFGEESLGLAFAQAALGKVDAGDTSLNRHELLDTLAWALFRNGEDAAATKRSAEALAAAPAIEQERFGKCSADLGRAIGEAAQALTATELRFAALTTEVSVQRTFRFAPDMEAERFLHDTLRDLLDKLDRLEQNEKAGVEQRLSWARQIQELTLRHPHAKHSWAEARAAIAKADHLVASRLYAGKAIELRDEEVMGLVPIGMNPVTRLWEFYELRSAWDGASDPWQLAIPAHEPDGSIKLTADTGIVFVLLPGGTFTLGAQKDDPQGPNYDPDARSNETPHPVTLSPFFLARHELTQGQWMRLWTWDQSLRDPSLYHAGRVIEGGRITLANPVEQVDWSMSDTLLSRHGMVLPTEAQWEYGCRGGTTTPWIVPFEDLSRVANLADADARVACPEWSCEEWRDGHVVDAATGSFAANGFGLYDVVGNVWEWCREYHGDYGSERPGDGQRIDTPSAGRIVRGGGYSMLAGYARSASREVVAPSVRNHDLGLRPARTFRH